MAGRWGRSGALRTLGEALCTQREHPGVVAAASDKPAGAGLRRALATLPASNQCNPKHSRWRPPHPPTLLLQASLGRQLSAPHGPVLRLPRQTRRADHCGAGGVLAGAFAWLLQRCLVNEKCTVGRKSGVCACASCSRGCWRRKSTSLLAICVHASRGFTCHLAAACTAHHFVSH